MCDFWHRIYFSVCNFQVYATCEFSVAPVHNPYHHSEEVCYYANIVDYIVMTSSTVDGGVATRNEGRCLLQTDHQYI